jgi:hypothetical protein
MPQPHFARRIEVKCIGTAQSALGGQRRCGERPCSGPMGEGTEKLQELRAVTFHLKTDPKGAIQYGLIFTNMLRKSET